MDRCAAVGKTKRKNERESFAELLQLQLLRSAPSESGAVVCFLVVVFRGHTLCVGGNSRTLGLPDDGGGARKLLVCVQNQLSE